MERSSRSRVRVVSSALANAPANHVRCDQFGPESQLQRSDVESMADMVNSTLAPPDQPQDAAGAARPHEVIRGTKQNQSVGWKMPHALV
jgi:hypothetical protein